MDQQPQDGKRFISPAGALLAAFCFFMPWVRACGRDLTGANMAQESPEWWLILLAALVIIGCFVKFGGEGRLSKIKPFIFGCSGISLFMMATQFLKIQSQGRGMIEIRFGALGTLLGFILALVGVQYLKDETAGAQAETPPQSTAAPVQPQTAAAPQPGEIQD